jgi:MYXO-CTERM domain-containing protein
MLALLAALTVAGRADASCADPFANPDEILDFRLRTTSTAWAELKASEPAPADTLCEEQYPYFPAEFQCASDEMPLSVGVRRKRDRTQTLQKLPLKLDFNFSVAGQRWPASRGELGFRKLTLNSGMADDAGRMAGMGREGDPGVLSALLTEALAWRLMRRELPDASGVAYARVTLELTDTGEQWYQGLYILLEDIDRTTVRARYAADQGLLTKTTDPSCPDEPVFDDGPPNSATDAFNGWLALVPADFPGGWYARTEQALALDELLRQEAFREVLANTTDTVLGNGNNRLTLDLAGGKRRYLPWDLDDLFRPFPQVHEPTTPLVRACESGFGCTQNPLATLIRDDPEIRPRYLEQLCLMTNGVLEESRVLSELAAVDALIRPILAEEVPVLWAPAGLDPLNAAVEGTYAAEVERMKSWIPARIQAVRALVAAEGVACAAGCEEGSVRSCDYQGLPSQRACRAGAWSACTPVAPTGSGGAAGSGSAGTPAAGASGAASGGAPGSGGVAGSAGSEPPLGGAAGMPVTGGDAGTGAAGAAPGWGGGSSGDRGGCGCRVGAPARSGASLGALAVLALVAWRRRFRRGQGESKAR